MATDLSRASSATSRRNVPAPGADQRSKILAAAISILGEHGAGALTVRSVAAAAGCSTTGVYTWFGGKNGLVEAIYVDGFERFGAALDVASHNADATTGASSAMAHAYRDWALENPTHYLVMFGGAVPDFEASPQARLTARGTFDRLIGETEATMARVGATGSPAEIAHHLWAGMHGYVSLELAGMDMTKDATVRADRYATGLRFLWRGCLGVG